MYILVNTLRALGEVTCLQCVIHGFDSAVHPVKNPSLRKRQFRNVQRRNWSKVCGETPHNILASLPDLIAESAVRMHDLNIEVKVAASGDVGEQGESKGISSAFRNTAGEGRLLILGRPRYLLLLQIAHQKLGVE